MSETTRNIIGGQWIVAGQASATCIPANPRPVVGQSTEAGDHRPRAGRDLGIWPAKVEKGQGFRSRHPGVQFLLTYLVNNRR